MSKKKKETELLDTTEICKEFTQILDTDPKYSINVDPENKYGMDDDEKKFIKYFIDYKDVAVAAKLTGIDEETAFAYYTSFGAQEEIRRINLALYQRQFNKKMLKIDEIGGYLSSLITDENVPLANRISTSEKVKVAQILLDIYRDKADFIEHPGKLAEKDIETQLKDLSVTTLKQLLQNTGSSEDKKEQIKEFAAEKQLSQEEIAYLRTLSSEELLKLISMSEKGEKENEQ